MRPNRLLLGGAAVVAALSAGAVTASVLQDSPREARPVQDPIGDILRTTPAQPANAPTETAPAAAPAPRTPVAVTPPPSVVIAEDQAVAEKAEEEVTDIEEHAIEVGESTVPEAGTRGSPRRSRRTAATKDAHTPNGNSTLSKDDSGIKDVNGRDSPTTEKEKGKKTGKGSPFDSWKRTKPGNSTAGMSPNKGRKRTSSSMEEGEHSTMSKKLRNR